MDINHRQRSHTAPCNVAIGSYAHEIGHQQFRQSTATREAVLANGLHTRQVYLRYVGIVVQCIVADGSAFVGCQLYLLCLSSKIDQCFVWADDCVLCGFVCAAGSHRDV